MAAYVILGDLFTFPEGDSSTNRVHAYARGLHENGINVHVVCFLNEYTHYKNGEFKGINYYHPFGQDKRSKSFLIRSWKKVLKFIRTVIILLKIRRKEKIDAIIVYTMLSGTFIFSWFLSLITGSKLIQEISEHPLRYYQKSTLKKHIGNIKTKTETSLADGILCISDYLIDFYSKRGMPAQKLLLVPSTVDPDRFVQNGSRPLPFPYIGYFGGLTFDRDNINVLIGAFALIQPKHPAVKLVLGGFCTAAERKQINDLIADLGISENTLFLEYLPREEIIKYIINSHVLVMVRSNDNNTQASFPSKLTEYLAASKPVISVNVGEISKYLTDGENSFIVEPGNMEELAGKIDFVLNDYESALKIAEKGKQLTKSVFNYNYQAKRVIPFVKSL
jgi:glycosyltransferase involved in cell wall biosynthesis